MSKSTKAQYNNPELYGVSLSPHSPRRLRLQQVKHHTAAAVDQAESFIISSSQETCIPSSSSTTSQQQLTTTLSDSTRSNELYDSLHHNSSQSSLNPHPNTAPHSRVPSSCCSCQPHSSSSQTTSFTPTLRHSSSTFFSSGSDADVSDHDITKFSAATAAAGIKTDLSSSIDCEYQYQVIMDDVSMTGENDETVIHHESIQHLEGEDDEWSQESIRYQQSNYGCTESDNESAIVNLSRSASIEQGEQEQSEIDRCDITSLSSMTDGISMCLTTTGRNRHSRVGRSSFHSYYNDNNNDGGANNDHHSEDSTTSNNIQPDHNNDSVVYRQALGGSYSLRAWKAQSSSPSSSMDVEEPFINRREKGRSSCCCNRLEGRGQEENNSNNQLNIWEIQPTQILLSRQQQHDSPLEQGLQLSINNQAAGNHQSSNSSHITDTHNYVELGRGCHNQQQRVDRLSHNINTMNNISERSRSPEQNTQMGNNTATTPAAAAEFDHTYNSSTITSDQFRTASSTELLAQSSTAAAAAVSVAAETEELVVGSFLQGLLQRETQHDEFFGTRSFLQHLNILRLERQSQRRQSNNRDVPLHQHFGSPSIPDHVASINTPYSPNASPNGNGQPDRVQEDIHHCIRHHYRTVINPAQPVRAGEHSDHVPMRPNNLDVPMRPVSAAEMNTNHTSHRSRLQPAAFHSRDPNNNNSRFHAATQTLPTFDRERILGLLQLRSQVVAQLDSRQAAANASSNETFSTTEYMNRVSGHQQGASDGQQQQQQQTRGTAMEYVYAAAATTTGGAGQPSRLDRKALLEQMRGPLHKSIISKIDHSSKFTDDVYEYRFVILPRYHPWFGLDIEEHLRESLMDEEEWRLLGIGHTRGWEHYGYSRHESNVFLFRRALGTDPKTGKLNCLHKTKVNERMKLLETLSKELEESRRSTAQFADGPTSFCCQRRRGKNNRKEGKGSMSDVTCSSSINANGAAASNPLVSTVSGFGSFQGGSMIDYASLIQQPSLHGNAGADRVNASTLTARHLAAVIRTGEVYPQPSMPFFDLPYTEDEEEDSEGLWHSNGDNRSVCTDYVDDSEEHNEREEGAVGSGVSSAECFLNDVDWLYASLHMPLYPTS